MVRPVGRLFRLRRTHWRLPVRRRRAARGGLLGWAVAGLFLVGVAAPFGDIVNALVKPHRGCRVWMVVDGDTVRLSCPGDGQRSGRVLGYDTPEFRGECLSERAMAMAATYYLRWLLWSGGEIGAELRGTDRHGRSLTRLTVGGRDVAGPMVAAGLARPYDGGRRAGWCGRREE